MSEIDQTGADEWYESLQQQTHQIDRDGGEIVHGKHEIFERHSGDEKHPDGYLTCGPCGCHGPIEDFLWEGRFECPKCAEERADRREWEDRSPFQLIIEKGDHAVFSDVRSYRNVTILHTRKFGWFIRSIPIPLRRYKNPDEVLCPYCGAYTEYAPVDGEDRWMCKGREVHEFYKEDF